MEVFWLFHKMSLCPTYNIEICETYFCHLTKHIQKVITVKYVHVATPLKTKWYIAERQGIWIWTKPPHASPFPYITIYVHIIKNYSILCLIIQRMQRAILQEQETVQFTGEWERMDSSSILFFPIPCLLIVSDAFSVMLFVSQTVECQEKILYMSHLWTYVNKDLDPWP